VRDHVVQLARDSRLLLALGTPRLLLDRRPPVARSLAQPPRADREPHREQRVGCGRGDDVRGDEAEQRDEPDEGDARRPRGRERADREQPRERHHELGRDGLEREPGRHGDGHHQLGLAAPPAQRPALDRGEREAEQHHARRRRRLRLVDCHEGEEDADAPRHGVVREPRDLARGRTPHAAIVPDRRRPSHRSRG
jgi:hypothetical protein